MVYVSADKTYLSADLLIANTILKGTDNAQKNKRFSDFIDDFDSGKRRSD